MPLKRQYIYIYSNIFLKCSSKTKCSCRSLSNSDEETKRQFLDFLEQIGGDKQNIDNLRLPLQVALLISPIFILQESQIHLSSFYVQRYKLAIVCTYLFYLTRVALTNIT